MAMEDRSFEAVTRLVEEKLADRGDTRPLRETDSLFMAGRLDSMAAVEIMLLLEADYGIDLADADFDISRIDTLRDLRTLVDDATTRALTRRTGT